MTKNRTKKLTTTRVKEFLKEYSGENRDFFVLPAFYVHLEEKREDYSIPKSLTSDKLISGLMGKQINPKNRPLGKDEHELTIERNLRVILLLVFHKETIQALEKDSDNYQKLLRVCEDQGLHPRLLSNLQQLLER